MKKITLLFSVILLMSFTPEVATTQQSKNGTVMICTGKYSKRYHTSPPSDSCRGMKACKGEKKKVTLKEAEKMGLTPCGYCYK